MQTNLGYDYELENNHLPSKFDYDSETEHIKSYKLVVDSLKKQLNEKDKLLNQFQTKIGETENSFQENTLSLNEYLWCNSRSNVNSKIERRHEYSYKRIGNLNQELGPTQIEAKSYKQDSILYITL